MNTAHHAEAIAATAASGSTVAASMLTQTHDWLVMLSALASLAWWIRLWLKDPNIRPPNP